MISMAEVYPRSTILSHLRIVVDFQFVQLSSSYEDKSDNFQVLHMLDGKPVLQVLHLNLKISAQSNYSLYFIVANPLAKSK